MKTLSNRNARLHFTQKLEELVCSKNCGIQRALYILSRNTSSHYKTVTQAADYIYNSLLSGNSFSAALKLCTVIEFDLVYISFICFAERCGTLEKTLSYLRKKCERENENFSRVIEASVYPVFVIIMAVAAGILLYSYSFSLLSGMEENSNELISRLVASLILSFSFLILFCATAILILKKSLGTDKLYEAFLAAGFLIKGGESLSNAVKDAVSILGYETKEGQLFARAGEKLSYGLSLKDSFTVNSWNGVIKQELEEAFFYAENSGGESDVFEKIAVWLATCDEKRRIICFKLIEPFFICGTGIFLLMFLLNAILPLFAQTTLLL